MVTKPDLAVLSALAREAGAAILEVARTGDLSVEAKADHSPLTQADRRAHEIIVAGLKAIDPAIPVYSEEGRAVPYAERRDWACFWLVDPLDGTKEFIRREQDFTVNIALIRGAEPVLGVVYAPARDWLYTGCAGAGAWKEAGGARQALPRPQAPRAGLVAVRSKSHASPEEDAFFARYEIADAVSMGSSLKFCLVAEGAADIYYRHGPTCEWDTAAAHAVVRASGGVVRAADGGELAYNKESCLNPGFVCVRDAGLLA